MVIWKDENNMKHKGMIIVSIINVIVYSKKEY